MFLWASALSLFPKGMFLMSSPHRLRHDLYQAPAIIKDPGSAGTITIDKDGGVCPVVTAAAEARTLRRPTKAGIVGTVVLKTDGGDLTLTVTGGYNSAGDTTLTFGDAGDWVQFESIEYGGSYYYRIVASEGVVLDDLATTAGVGITGAADNFASSVEKVGSLFKTTIVIDIDGLNCGGTAGDIIGADGAGVAHLGQITALRNGTIFAGTLRCIEAPTGGDPDIDLWSAVEATGVEDTAIAALDETQLCNSGDLAAGSQIPLTAYPAADEYLYLACGTATDATYTAGIVVIELWGK